MSTLAAQAGPSLNRQTLPCMRWPSCRYIMVSKQGDWLCLWVTKVTQHGTGDGTGYTMVIREGHLWLNLVEMWSEDKFLFLDAPISQAAFYGEDFPSTSWQTENRRRPLNTLSPSIWPPPGHRGLFDEYTASFPRGGLCGESSVSFYSAVVSTASSSKKEQFP